VTEDDVDDIPDLGDLDDDDSDDEAEPTPEEHSPERLGHGHCTKSPNTQIWDGNHDVEMPMKQYTPKGALNQQFLKSLNRKLALGAICSNDLKGIMTQMKLNTDPDDGTLDWLNQMILGAKANSEDAPTGEKAINGYWEACEKELNTLSRDKDVWDVNISEPWMNVLPSTWAFKSKQYPDGSICKLKSRFCV